MRRLAIVAHWDPRGAAAPHFLRQLDQLRTIADDVVVASPSPLTDEAAAAISQRATLLRRQNYGHDFGSWRDALEQYDWAQGHDELLLTNDSYAGYFRPIDRIFAEMSQRPCEVWGITKSWRHGEHIQSYFLAFTAPALKSQAFQRFWSDAKPAADRQAAIHNQEVGISRAMLEAGFALGSYFEPTRRERLRATRRGAHWLWRRQNAFPAHFDSLTDKYFRGRDAFDPSKADYLNWSSAFADATLDDGRLPLIKFDTFRFDPYWLGAGELLTALERAHPALMDGVRRYLDETNPFYTARPLENFGFAKLNPIERLLFGYSTRAPRGRG
ncbi:rhamnan synthesis F family protein [Microbacterium paludicola]|uniref:rhamnan synthesis F family protein n=1 Tax=Microbacterium paludicola TaxID=300019 RepID=UPI00387A3691